VEEAEGVFKAALGLDTANVTANGAFAAFYVASSRAPEAERYLKKAADTSTDPAAGLGLAEYSVSMRRSAEARAVLEKLIATQRTWPIA
jgi:thioredoxin-like negative regulator of GroEL